MSGFSSERVKALESDWRNLFDQQLKGCEGDDSAVAEKIYQAFLGNPRIANSERARSAMRDIVYDIRSLYNPNRYHAYFHAGHVLLSASLLSKTLFIPLSIMDHFALLFSALIHDIGHEGVFNSTLVSEGHAVAITYNDVSCAEMHSIRTGLDILKKNQLELGFTQEDYIYLRKIIVDLVLNTDLADPWRGKTFKLRYDQFSEDGRLDMKNDNCKLVGMILMLKMSDVSSLLQSFETVLEWAHRFFDEQSIAFLNGRGPPVTSEVFDRNQVMFLNGYCLDLVHMVEKSGISCIPGSIQGNITESMDKWKADGKKHVVLWEEALVRGKLEKGY